MSPDQWTDVFTEVFTEFVHAHQKHKGYTPADPNMPDGIRLVILVEEVGEVARAMTYDNGSRENLRKELIQVATMALAWTIGMSEEECPIPFILS